ncbi:protein BatD [bacterium SCSIO 12643]|nr:protein BatD [bacterium SCSIO 12643]
MNRLILFILFLTSGIASAQTPVLNALVSKNTVPEGGNFTLSFQFNASGDDFTAPGNLTKDFRILRGPSKSSEMRYINGKMSSSVSYSYILSPLNKGKYTIEPARIQFEGKTYKSKPVEITVTEASANQNGNGSATTQSEVNRQEKQKKELKKNIFIRLEVNKRTVYQGEQIIATYKLYNRASLRGIEAQRMPEFDGFYTSDIEISNNNNHTREIIKGMQYDVFTLKKTILIPQKTGELTLIPLEVDAVVQIQGSKPVNTWFGPRYQMKDVNVLLKSNPIKINVKPLPPGAPEGFSGAVGQFNFSTKITPTELAVNDALNYSIKISGSGNIPLIDHPVPNWPQEFEVYDPKLKSSVNNKANRLAGAKTWEYLAIPRNGGTYEFPSISFSYFDLATKKYKTIESEAVEVNVSGTSDAGSGGAQGPGVNRQDVSRLGTDIRFIHTKNPELEMEGTSFFNSVWYYFWIVVPIFLAGLAYIILRRQNELQADTIGMKKRKATKFAKRLLKQAEETLKSNNKNAFYESVFKALNGYLANKLNIANTDLNKSFIQKKLLQHQVSENTVQLLITTLDHCEMARFAPVSQISDAELLEQAQNIIVKLEDEIK